MLRSVFCASMFEKLDVVMVTMRTWQEGNRQVIAEEMDNAWSLPKLGASNQFAGGVS